MLRTAARKLSLSLVLVAILGASALGAGVFTPAQSYADWPISYGSSRSGSCVREVLVLKHVYMPYVGIIDFWVWEAGGC